MDRTGNQLLSGARFAGDEDRGPAFGDFADDVEDPLHLLRGAHDGAEVGVVGQLASKDFILGGQAGELQRLAHGQPKLVRLKGLVM